MGIKALFVGDVALGDHPKTIGFGFYSRYKDNVPFDKAKNLFPPEMEVDVKFVLNMYYKHVKVDDVYSQYKLNCGLQDPLFND